MDLLREIFRTLAEWLKGEMQVVVVLALLYTAGFVVAGAPVWYLLGPLCAMLYLLPVFGAPIGLLLALGITFFSGRPWANSLEVLAVWVVVQTLEGFYLTPRILGKRTRLGPVTIFLGVVVGSSFFGFFGILLAVPVMAVAMVIWRYFQPKHSGPPAALK